MRFSRQQLQLRMDRPRRVDDLDNASGATGYTDFTSITENLTGSSTVNVTLTPEFSGSTYTEYWKIFIDNNGDHDFEDSGEEVFSGSGSAAVSGSFTVPSVNIVTRKRVSMSYSSAPTSCGTFTYGEVEDYTVDISSGSVVEMYVYDITQTITKQGRRYESTGVVTVWDTDNSPVANATVSISWGGVVSGSDSGVTNSSGQVTFTSSRNRSTGLFTIPVNNVTHATLNYNSSLNNETTDSQSY